jgi:vacuolar-type H+-ATPase subunit E/Vma4
MSIEDILEALDEQCRDECQAIFAEAQKEVEKILSQAEAEAEQIRQAKMGKVKVEVASEIQSMLYSARLRAKNIIINAKEEILSETFRQAQEMVKNIRSERNYPQIFEALLREALAKIGGDGIVHVDKGDEALAGQVLKEMGVSLPVMADIQCDGGVVISDRDNRVHIINTVEERLVRAKERMRLAISELLFGEEEQISLSVTK